MNPDLLTQKTGIRGFAFRPGKRGYVSTIGYNCASTVYTQDQSIGKFSGSSLNRKISKIKKDEYQKTIEEQKKKAEENGRTFIDMLEDFERSEQLRSDQKARRRNQKRISDTFDRSKLSISMFAEWFDRNAKKGMDQGNGDGLAGRDCRWDFRSRLKGISKRTRGKIRDKSTALFNALGEEKTFCTLTFIQHITDDQAISILNKFFTMVRQLTGDSPLLYLWVAERQMIGRIHFHIILNKYLPVKQFNALWVRQQYHAGLRHKSIDASLIDYMDDYQISSYLNPLDIVKIKAGNQGDYQLSWYLTKYIIKNESRFTCQSWNCSEPVSRLFTRQVASKQVMKQVYGMENSRVDRKTGEVVTGKMVEGKFFRLVYIQNRPFFYRKLREMEDINRWILTGACPNYIPEIAYIEDFFKGREVKQLGLELIFENENKRQ